jgi:hypothetical protein
MAINKITAPLSTSPSVFAAPVINQLAALLADCNHGTRVSGGYVKKGSLWNIGGTMFLADSDTAITGTRSDATTGVMFTVSGDAATVSYGTDAVTWSGASQGYYDSSSNYYYCGEMIAGSLELYNSAYSATITTTNATTTYTKKYAYKISKAGFYRVKTGVTGSTYGGNTAHYGYALLYINDSSVGTELSNNTATVTYQTKDVWCEENDELELYFKSNYDGYKYGYTDFTLTADIYSGSTYGRTV